VTKIILKAKKRKAGTRAGMTRAKIVDAATKLWLSGGPDNFSIRAVVRASVCDGCLVGLRRTLSNAHLCSPLVLHMPAAVFSLPL